MCGFTGISRAGDLTGEIIMRRWESLEAIGLTRPVAGAVAPRQFIEILQWWSVAICRRPIADGSTFVRLAFLPNEAKLPERDSFDRVDREGGSGRDI